MVLIGSYWNHNDSWKDELNKWQDCHTIKQQFLSSLAFREKKFEGKISGWVGVENMREKRFSTTEYISRRRHPKLCGFVYVLWGLQPACSSCITLWFILRHRSYLFLGPKGRSLTDILSPAGFEGQSHPCIPPVVMFALTAITELQVI